MKPKAILWSVGGIFGVAILIGLAWPGIAVYRNPESRDSMQVLYAQLSLACQQYKQEYGTYPDSSENKDIIAALTGGNPRKIIYFETPHKQLNEKREVLDKWGNPIRIIFPADAAPSFVSAGKDGIFGTADDTKDKREIEPGHGPNALRARFMTDVC